MAKVSMKSLLETGVHFGHRTHRWNPKMKPYIFTERNGIHIIDLQQTVNFLVDAYNIVRDVVADGGTILFVGTKRQAHETIIDEADRCGMPYVSVRWLGGMLTNWITMRQRILELERLERMREEGEFERLTKKEGLMLTRKIDKLEARFGGIRDMHKIPDLIFVVDIRREETAVKEANTLHIPVIALVDTNCDPNTIDHIIPSNDDAIRAIKIMVGNIADAVLEGKGMRKDDEEELPDKVVDEGAEQQEELTDADLLGEATLAKMEAQAEAEAVAEAEKEKIKEAEEAETSSDEDSEASESDDSEAGETDDSEAGETDDSEAGETDDSEAGETDDSEAGETKNSEAGETDDSEAGETKDSEADESEESKAELEEESSEPEEDQEKGPAEEKTEAESESGEEPSGEEEK